MGNEIVYCEGCGRMIRESEMIGGEVLSGHSATMCPSCAEAMTPAQRQDFVRKDDCDGRTTSRVRVSSRQKAVVRQGGRRGRELPMKTWLLFPVGVVGGLLLGLLILEYASDNEGPGPHEARARSKPQPGEPAKPSEDLPGPAAKAAAATTGAASRVKAETAETSQAAVDSDGAVALEAAEPPAAAPDPAPVIESTARDVASNGASSEARERFERLREIPDPPFFGRYDEFVLAAGEFLGQFGDSPEAEEVKALLARVNGQYAEQVEANLLVAVEAAERSLAAGEYARASKAFAYVRMRFGESEWFREHGEARIAAVLKKIEDARADFEKAGVSVADSFTDYAEGSDGSPGWRAAAGWRMRGGAFVADGAGVAVANVPEATTVSMQATIVPRARTGADGWTMVGLSLHKDDTNYWYLCLVQAPDGPRYMEFNEKLNGVWMAQQNASKLTCTQAENIGWEYNKPYTFRIEVTPAGILGSVVPAGGNRPSKVAFKFDNVAVRTGRPALRVEGTKAEFLEVSAVARGGAAR